MKKAATDNKEEKRKVMTYRNNNKRVIRLVQLGLIEETRKSNPDAVNLHGRKDYKLTQKGAEQLAPYLLTHPEDVEDISYYAQRNGLNIQKLNDILVDYAENFLKSMNLHMESINAYLRSNPGNPLQYTVVARNPAQLDRLFSLTSDFVKRLFDNQTALVMQGKQLRSKWVNPIASAASTNDSDIDSSGSSKNIDTILAKHYQTLQHKLMTTNIMSTLQDNGMKIRLSTIHPHKPKEIARLTEQNIGKMKKTLPRTPKIVEYLERLIESIDQIEAKRPTTKTIRPFIISTKS